MRIIALLVSSFLIAGCSSLTELRVGNEGSQKNPLKSIKDLQIEKVLTSGKWIYEPQHDDCKDTHWEQTFYKNRYYKSVGAACLIPNAFSVDAENWHTKNRILYVTNLSPIEGDDIILKYRIDFLDRNRLVLISGKYKYTFNNKR